VLDVLADDEVTRAEDLTDTEVLDCTELSTATRDETDFGVPVREIVLVERGEGRGGSTSTGG